MPRRYCEVPTWKIFVVDRLCRIVPQEGNSWFREKSREQERRKVDRLSDLDNPCIPSVPLCVVLKHCKLTFRSETKLFGFLSSAYCIVLTTQSIPTSPPP